MMPGAIDRAVHRCKAIKGLIFYSGRKVQYRKGAEGVCYTVTIRGEEKRLFLEWMDSTFASRVARWYVETVASDAG